jgi:hypothetical protein
MQNYVTIRSVLESVTSFSCALHAGDPGKLNCHLSDSRKTMCLPLIRKLWLIPYLLISTPPQFHVYLSRQRHGGCPTRLHPSTRILRRWGSPRIRPPSHHRSTLQVSFGPEQSHSRICQDSSVSSRCNADRHPRAYTCIRRGK